MRRLLPRLLGAALLCGLVTQAQAQNFPDRPIRLIVPYAPAGITDITARILAPKLGDELGVQVIVDNRPGGAAMIGFGLVANSPADGYTILVATTALAANPILFKNIPYGDTRKAFTPVSLVGVVPCVLVVPPDSPAKTIAEFVALAKATPGSLNFGSAGNGSDNHLAAEQFNYLTGIKAQHVTYRGGGQVMTDLMAGRVGYVFSTLPTARPLILDGRLRALATTGQTRSPALPDAPTVAEKLLPNFVFYAWLGLMAPAGTPPAIIEKLNKAVTAALQHPETAEKLRTIGHELRGGAPEVMGAHLNRELDRWAELAKHVKFEVSE
jgi:tripartite-type tricarboxylate transporter receptor subunit TctC